MKNGLFKRPGSAVWHCQYRAWDPQRQERRTIKESTGCLRESDAKAYRDAKRSASAKGQLVPSARTVTFEDLVALLITDYIKEGNSSLGDPPSAEHYKLKNLKAAFGGELARNITTVRVDAYQAQRRTAGASQATINSECALLRRMFSLAVEKDLLERAPVIKTPDPKNARTGFVEPETFARLLAALPEYLRPVAQFALLTGWRKAEILRLTWDRVDWRAGVVRLDPNTTKNGKGREFPFKALPALKTVLEHQLRTGERYSSHHVFHHHGRPIRDFYTAWRQACTAARCEGLILHDFRRTAVRNLVRAGVSESVAMKITGHETREVFERYNITSGADLVEGVAKLARALEAVAVA